jgi:hypothetical protein
MFGPSRAPKPAEVSVGQPAKLAWKDPAHPRIVKNLRDSHHMVARLVATGMAYKDVAVRTGYSAARVTQLMDSPAFIELVAHYRAKIDDSYVETFDTYFDYIGRNGVIAERLLNDKLTESEHDDFSVQQLVAISANAADRTGYPKRHESINLNVDFAAQLDRATKRAKEVKATSDSSKPVSQAVSNPADRRPGTDSLAHSLPTTPSPPTAATTGEASVSASPGFPKDPP